jgi:hypothetical protein
VNPKEFTLGELIEDIENMFENNCK